MLGSPSAFFLFPSFLFFLLLVPGTLHFFFSFPSAAVFIMHFFSIAAATFISTALAVRGSPLPPFAFNVTTHKRAAVQFHVVTDGPEACTEEQITAINNGIIDAKKLADIAIKVMQVKGMTASNGFFHFFGAPNLPFRTNTID